MANSDGPSPSKANANGKLRGYLPRHYGNIPNLTEEEVNDYCTMANKEYEHLLKIMPPAAAPLKYFEWSDEDTKANWLRQVLDRDLLKPSKSFPHLVSIWWIDAIYQMLDIDPPPTHRSFKSEAKDWADVAHMWNVNPIYFNPMTAMPRICAWIDLYGDLQMTPFGMALFEEHERALDKVHAHIKHAYLNPPGTLGSREVRVAMWPEKQRAEQNRTKGLARVTSTPRGNQLLGKWLSLYSCVPADDHYRAASASSRLLAPGWTYARAVEPQRPTGAGDAAGVASGLG